MKAPSTTQGKAEEAAAVKEQAIMDLNSQARAGSGVKSTFRKEVEELSL